MDWQALKETIETVSVPFIDQDQLDWGVTFPETYNESLLEDEQFVKDLHFILVKR